MILYQYPDKVSKNARKNSIVERHNERMKLNKIIRRNVIISILIAALAFFTDVLWARILLVLIGAGTVFSWFLLMKLVYPKESDKIITEIHDDRLVNTQYNFWGNKLYRYNIPYNCIKKTTQTMLGYLKIELKNSENCLAECIDRKNKKCFVKIRRNIVIKINDSNTKYFLIREMKLNIYYE